MEVGARRTVQGSQPGRGVLPCFDLHPCGCSDCAGFDLPTSHISAQSTRGDLQPHSGLLMHGRNN